MNLDRGDLVFTSEDGLTCPDCGKARVRCSCTPPEPEVPSGDGVVRVRRETKGRKGKGVTIVSGVPLAGAELTKLAKALKKRCGSGGTVKGAEIEIQGDQRDVLVTELQARGYTVKRAGG
jgi:translation initiation factor 1